MTPILSAFPTSFQSFSYFSGSEVAILVKRSRDFLMRVRWSWLTNREEVMVSRETVRLERQREEDQDHVQMRYPWFEDSRKIIGCESKQERR